MKLERVDRNVQTSGVQEVAKATIRATPKIFEMFADQTYANKPLAIARELTANGVDSHIAAGTPNTPVEVTLPTELDPVFKVRDFGTGMSHDFMMTSFMAYTDGSTKDKSNDQIGGFGIGSKSPFAYTDQFTIRSVHKNILSIYSVFKDDDGIPAIGLLGQKTTDEHDGVEVSFPVELDDQASFREAAQEALQYFKPLPIVHNGTIDPPKYTYQGDNWSLRPESGSLGVIMGGVRYPVTTNNLDWGIRSDKDISPLLEYGIDLFLPIGAVGVALSREQLSYNEKTNKVLKEALKSIIEDVTATFATMFDSEPTVWEAQRKLGEEIGTGYQPREKLLAGHAKYKGQPLSQFYSFPERVVSQLGQHPFPASLWYIPDISDYRRKTTRVTKVDWKTPRELGSVRPSNIAQIVVDDLPDENKSRAVAKIKVFVEGTSQDKATLVLRANERTDKKAIAALLAKMGSPANVVYTSTLPEPPKHASARNTNRPRVRMFGYDGAKIQQGWHKVHPDSLVPSDNKRGHVWEIDYADQPDGGVIVVMSQFRLPNNFYYYMNSGLFEYTELHFVNEGDWKKLDTTKWTKFEDEFNKRINDKLAAIPELGERLAIDAALGNRDDLRKVSETGRLSAKELARQYGKLVTLWETYVKPLDEEQKRLTPYVTVKLPTGVDPKKIIEQFNDKQPDARILLNVLNLDQDSHLDLFIRNL